MSNIATKTSTRIQRKKRIRSKISGDAKRPRLSVYISNKHITAQLIDDVNGRTIAYASTSGLKSITGTLTEQATYIGNEIALKAKGAKIKSVVFDRGGRIYHGRVAALAESARKAGLEF